MTKFDDERIAAWLSGDLAPDEAEALERQADSDPALRRRVEEMRLAFAVARKWIEADPPGLERAAAIQISPPMENEAPVAWAERERPLAAAGGGGGPRFTPRRWRPLILHGLRTAAVAAIFVIGFGLGRVTQEPGPGMEPNALLAPGEHTGGHTGGLMERPEAPMEHSSGIADDPRSPAGVAEAHGDRRTEGPLPPTRVPVSAGAGPDKTPEAARAPQTVAPPSDGADLASARPPIRRASEENGRLIIETTLTQSRSQAVWVVDAGFRKNEGLLFGMGEGQEGADDDE